MAINRRKLLQLGVGAAGVLLAGCQFGRVQARRPALNFDAAHRYSVELGGHSLLAYQDGKILYERYEPPFDADLPIHMASATKSFWGIVAAAMVDDGLLDFDEPAAKTLDEWRQDPVKSKITVRHLLDLSSGLAEDIPAIQGYKRRDTWAEDKYLHAIGLPLVSAPGSRFRYGPSHFYALGEVFKRKLGRDPLLYLDERILQPIGCSYGSWVHDDAGNVHIPNGCYMTARNWLRFGQFVMAEGRLGKRQLIDARLIRACMAPSPANPGFGLTWWLNRPGGRGSNSTQNAPRDRVAGFIYRDGHPNMVAALGAGRNGLYLVPDLDLILVRQFSQDHATQVRFVDHGMFSALFDT
ncbi:MAG: serine hydrolase domain-containing protein [Pseudomonadota bacterium]